MYQPRRFFIANAHSEQNAFYMVKGDLMKKKF